MVLRASILISKIDTMEREMKKYKQMKLRQKTLVDSLLEEFPWFKRRQMTILKAFFNSKAKLRQKIARNFYTKLEKEEDQDSEFTKHMREVESL